MVPVVFMYAADAVEFIYNIGVDAGVYIKQLITKC